MLPKRFGKYGLTLHPEKTRLVKFTRPPWTKDRSGPPPEDGPGTFDLLGFTHYWGKSHRGHFSYYGITGNFEALSRFLREVERTWRKWLSRRSHKGTLSWPRFKRLLKRYPLPKAEVVHSVYQLAARP